MTARERTFEMELAARRTAARRQRKASAEFVAAQSGIGSKGITWWLGLASALGLALMVAKVVL